MAQIQSYLCEVCGQHKQPSDPNWYLAAENQWKNALDIFIWDDKLAVEPDMMHVCSAEHLECLICDWMLPGSDLNRRAAIISSEPFSEANQFRRAALRLSELSVDRSLLSTEGADPNNVMAVIDAIENVLQTCENGSYPVFSQELQHCDA